MSLTEKLKKISDSEKKQEIDISKIRLEWQTEVEKTLNETKEWFKDYIAQNVFKVLDKEKTIREEIIGEYKVKQLEYEFGKFSLVFEPVGRNILGAWGRMDVYLRGNKTDKYILVLLGEKFDTSKWFISSFQDKSTRTEFNKTNLEKIIENWIDKNTY